MALVVAYPKDLPLELPLGVEGVTVPPWEGKALEAVYVVINPTLKRGFMEVIPKMTHLRYVQTTTAGVDWIAGSLPPALTLLDASGVYDIPVAEWVVSAILQALKRWTDFWELQKEGSWKPAPLEELHSKTVLLLGYGSIGRAVEERLKPFGVRILRVARRPREGIYGVSDLPTLLPQAEIVVILLPLTPETWGFVNADFLARLPRGALLVNAGRGGVVDTQALLQAAEEGRVRAVLDVTDPEPLPQTHPLWRAPGVWITPHVAGFDGSPERSLERVAALVRAQLERLVAGVPLANVVQEGY